MHLNLALLALGVFALPALSAVGVDSPHTLTIVYEAESDHSHISFAAMQRELVELMQGSGRAFAFRSMKDLRFGEEFQDVVVVRFKGVCRFTPMQAGRLRNERALAFTHSSDGEVLPFAEVLCDRVLALMRPAMSGGDLDRADELYGRALARVLAHELYHICAKTHKHGSHGIAQTTLTGEQLIRERFDFDPEDLAKLRRREPPAPVETGEI